ncbi:MAG TPA: DUF2207 domain-containing protein, partial [Candidatus Saccharimonadales bacterium]
MLIVNTTKPAFLVVAKSVIIGRMKQLVLACLLLATAWVVPVNAQGRNVDDFVIESFKADYRLSRDSNGMGRMAVAEEIVAVFPDFDQNHGILRAIPATYGEYNLNLQINSVTDGENRPHPYSTYAENDNLILRIGDADTYVHGPVVYVIEYSVKNMITFYDEHDEFFWDINGDAWSQPFGLVEATIFVPDELALNLFEQTRCFSGSFSSTAADCQVDKRVAEDGVVVKASAKDLSAEENLSIVLGFDSGTFFE